jgi:hypothetical protein
MVHITEASVAGEKALRGLAVSVSLRDGETVESDFYRIKDAMLDWKRMHDTTATAMLIEYHAPDSTWQQIENFWHARIDSDHLVRSVFFSVRKVTLCLMSPDGRDIRQVGFELGDRHDNAA